MISNEQAEQEYYAGKGFSLNRLSVWYFYLQTGLNKVNEFKYIIGFIIALYYAAQFDNFWLMPLAFLVVLPILIVLGALWVKFFAKRIDWLGTKFATHWSKYGFELQEKQVELLEEINKKLNTPKINCGSGWHDTPEEALVCGNHDEPKLPQYPAQYPGHTHKCTGDCFPF